MSIDLRLQLAAYGDLFAAELDTLTVEDVMVKRVGDGSVKALEPVVPANRRQRRGAWLAAAVFVIVAAIGAAAFLATRGSDDVATIPPGWSRVLDEGRFTDANIVAITEGGPGYVAVGTDAFGQNGKVWTSDDGRSWQQVSDANGVFSDAAISDVTAGGSGLVAVGTDLPSNGAVVWTSANGEEWAKVALDPDVIGADARLNAITAGGPGLVAVGEYGPGQLRENAAWTSADGVEWSVVDLPGSTQPLDVTAGGPGVVAVGNVPELNQMVIWTSTDGLHWTIATNEHLGDPDAIADGAFGLIAIGEDFGDGPLRSSVLSSVDATQWEVSADVLGSFTAITYADGRYVAVGGLDTGDAAVATSTDGVTWIVAEADPGVFAEARMTGVAGSTSVVVVGKSGLRDGAIWTYSDG
jgi:hypothetical protein